MDLIHFHSHKPRNLVHTLLLMGAMSLLLALSRVREFDVDLHAARLTGDPERMLQLKGRLPSVLPTVLPSRYATGKIFWQG